MTTSKAKAAPKKAAAPAVDVAGIEKALMVAVRQAVPGSRWTKKAFYQRLNVKGDKRSVVALWRQKAQLRMEFPDGHGSLEIFRLHSLADVPKGVAEVQRYVAARKEERHAS